MSKVICPECNTKNNSKSTNCQKCGFSIIKYIQENHFDDYKYINICPNCAKVELPSKFTPLQLKCSYCGTKLIHTDKCTKKQWRSIPSDEHFSTDLAYLTEDMGITDYSKEDYEKRTYADRIQFEKNYVVPEIKEKPTIKCPYCSSTNCKRITTTNRVASVALVGIASNKIGKQWHCNNCKSDF